MTGDRKSNFYTKKILGYEDLVPYFSEFLLKALRDYGVATWGKAGVLNAAVINIGYLDAFQITTDPVSAVDGEGHVLRLSGSEVFKFENALAATYSIALSYCEIPATIEINPRTGALHYGRTEEAIGTVGTPDEMTDPGDGTVYLRIDPIAEVGQSFAGRFVKAWLVSPETSVEASAFEVCTVQRISGHNWIKTTGKFGQSTISTDPASYAVALLGPKVSKVIDYSVTGTSVCLGEIVGSGAGHVPASVSTAKQRVYLYGGLGGISDVLEGDAHASTKVRVRADTLDTGHGIRQISVLNAAGREVFRVDEAGKVVFGNNVDGGGDGATKSSLTIKGGPGSDDFDWRIVNESGVLVFKSSGETVIGEIPIGGGLRGYDVDPLGTGTILGEMNRATRRGTIDGVLFGDALLAGGNVLSHGVGSLVYAGFACQINGDLYSLPNTTVTVGTGAKSYLVTDGLTISLENSFAEAPGKVILAYVETDGGGHFTTIRNIAIRSANLDGKTEILVGGTTGSVVYSHFETITAALEAIAERRVPTTGTGASRRYSIRIVAPTTEPAGIVIPIDGISIEGLGDGVDSVLWSSNAPLFDLNGKSDLTFRNFRAYNTSAGLPTIGQARTVFKAQATASNNVKIEDVMGGGLGGLNGFFLADGVTGGLTNSRIRNCKGSNLADFGIVLNAGSHVLIENPDLTQSGTNTGGTYLNGIEIGAAVYGATVRGGTCGGSFPRALYSLGAGTIVDAFRPNGTFPAGGIVIDTAVKGTVLSNCDVLTDSTVPARIAAIQIRGSFSKVIGCTASITGIGAAGAERYAIWLDGAVRAQIIGNDLQAHGSNPVSIAQTSGDYAAIVGNNYNGVGPVFTGAGNELAANVV